MVSLGWGGEEGEREGFRDGSLVTRREEAMVVYSGRLRISIITCDIQVIVCTI